MSFDRLVIGTFKSNLDHGVRVIKKAIEDGHLTDAREMISEIEATRSHWNELMHGTKPHVVDVDFPKGTIIASDPTHSRKMAHARIEVMDRALHEIKQFMRKKGFR